MLRPAEDRGRLLAAWRYYQSRDTSTTAERIRLRRRLTRLKDLYLDGEMNRAEYQAERKAVADAIAALPAESDPDSDAGERLAAFLADVASAWNVATPMERNKLARQLFASVVVSNRTAVAVVPRPDLRPFFFALPRPEGVNDDGKECTGGSDGDRFRVFILSTVAFASRSRTSAPTRTQLLGGHRGMTRPQPAVSCPCSQADPEQEAEIRALAGPRACAPSPPTSASAMRPSGPWCDRIARSPYESCRIEQARSHIEWSGAAFALQSLSPLRNREEWEVWEERSRLRDRRSRILGKSGSDNPGMIVVFGTGIPRFHEE